MSDGSLPPARNVAYRATSPLRRLTASRRSAADVVIVGAQKSGTTYLAELLGAQRGFYLPPVKEIHYFTAFWHRGWRWYSSHFQMRSSPAAQVDSSPSYMIHRSVPHRIRSTNPLAKVIFILRDPVERAFSHYQHNRRAGVEPLGFAEALAAEDDRIGADLDAIESDPAAVGVSLGLYSYRHRGRYADHLRRFQQVLPPENLLVLDAEAVFEHDAEEVAMLEEFLQRDVRLDASAGINRHEGEYARRTDPAHRRLREYFDALDPDLAAAAGRRFSWMRPDVGTGGRCRGGR